MVLLIIVAVFLIVLVLIQRGKGGGLAGAFGGMGGQSAFGTKAGDLFTKITIGMAAFWIILCMITVKVLSVSGGVLSEGMGGAEEEAGRRRPGRPRQASARRSAHVPSPSPEKPAAVARARARGPARRGHDKTLEQHKVPPGWGGSAVGVAVTLPPPNTQWFPGRQRKCRPRRFLPGSQSAIWISLESRLA